MNLRWLLMAKRWTQNPPSMGRVKLVAGIVVICLVLYGIEQMFGTPAWMTLNGNTRIIR